MRVLYITFDLGLGGGIGTFSYELLMQLLEKKAFEIHVIAGRIDPLLNLNLTLSKKLRIYTINVLNIPPKDVISYFINSNRIKQFIERVKPDVIHDLSGAVGQIPWISKFVPTIVTIHGSPLIKYIRLCYGSLSDKLRAILFDISHKIPSSFLRAVTNSQVSRYIFVSKTCLADTLINSPSSIREIIKRRSKVIYNGLNVETIRKFNQEEPNPFDIIVVSRLMEYKGAHRAVKALLFAVKEIPEIKLHIVGDGPLKTHILHLVEKHDLKKHVVLHGWLPRPKVLMLLAKCKLLIHPSLYESFGYVIAEAYALGKPVIAHKAPYSREIVENLGAGITVNTFDAKEFAEAIVDLLTDRNLYSKMSERALYIANTYFNIKFTAEKYMQVYTEVLNE